METVKHQPKRERDDHFRETDFHNLFPFYNMDSGHILLHTYTMKKLDQ